jgi:2-keto-3-deoxy-6-phosphogluconate aldolase
VREWPDRMKKTEVIQRIKDIGIIPVVRASSEEEAVPGVLGRQCGGNDR